MPDYIQLESGAPDRITLEDASGFILLQSDGIVAASGELNRFGVAGTGKFFGAYRRRPQLGWHDDEGLSVVQDTGGSIQVQRSFEQWSLARASRYLYRGTAHDFNAPAPEEPETLAPFLVRLPFRSLGHNPYRWRTSQDLGAPTPPAEVDTLAQFLVRRNLGGRWWVVPGHVFDLAPQDFDAPPPPAVEGGDYIITLRRRRRS